MAWIFSSNVSLSLEEAAGVSWSIRCIALLLLTLQLLLLPQLLELLQLPLLFNLHLTQLQLVLSLLFAILRLGKGLLLELLTTLRHSLLKRRSLRLRWNIRLRQRRLPCHLHLWHRSLLWLILSCVRLFGCGNERHACHSLGRRRGCLLKILFCPRVLGLVATGKRHGAIANVERCYSTWTRIS